jgi:DinB family protein
MNGELARLLAFLDQGYARRSWHGPNLKGSLRGLDVALASFRPGPDRHCIWEIAVHAAYWKHAVLRRITGEPRGSFPLAGSNWFVRPGDAETPAALRADLRLLDEMHERLRDAVSGLDQRRLGERPRGSRFALGELVSGAAAHDLYHAGQIQLLKRLFRSP